MPAADRAAAWLRDAIARGDFPSGAWLPAERDLAERIGVGRPAVREAIAALLREGVLERRPGGRPRIASWAAGSYGRASTSAAGRFIVAAVIPQPPTYTTAHAIQAGLSRALGGSTPRPGLLVYDSYLAGPLGPGLGVHPEIEAFHRAEAEGAAGVVVWGCGADGAEEMLLRMQRSGLAVVFVDHRPKSLAFDFVGVENRSGIRAAVEHLHALGHRRIAYLSHPDRGSAVVEREEGYTEALHDLGHRADPAMLYRGGRSLSVRAREALEQFMAHPTPPTAVVAVNDLHAFELIQAAQERGLKVPGNLSVVGFDDAEQFSPHQSMLTTVRQPFREIGYCAGELLLRRIAEGSAPVGIRIHTLLAPTLTVRTTTARPSRRS